jgi:hypothetical protein
VVSEAVIAVLALTYARRYNLSEWPASGTVHRISIKFRVYTEMFWTNFDLLCIVPQ